MALSITFLGAYFIEGSSTVVELVAAVNTAGADGMLILAKHEGAATTITVNGDNDVAGGFTSYTKASGGTGGTDVHAQAFFKANPTGSATDTPQVNFAAARTWGALAVFRIDSDAALEFIDEVSGAATTDPINLGDLTATAAYVAAMMIPQYGEGAHTFTAPWTERDAEAHTMAIADASGSAGAVTVGSNPAATPDTVGVAVLFQEVGSGGGGGSSGMSTFLKKIRQSYRPRPFAPGRGR